MNDVCDGAGTCTGTPKCAGVTCPSATDCLEASSCIPTTGQCGAQAPKAAATPCNDGDTTTFNDACDGTGACTGCRGSLPLDESYRDGGAACAMLRPDASCKLECNTGYQNATAILSCPGGVLSGPPLACTPVTTTDFVFNATCEEILELADGDLESLVEAVRRYVEQRFNLPVADVIAGCTPAPPPPPPGSAVAFCDDASRGGFVRADDTDESTLISRPRLANGTFVVRITFGSGVSPSDVAFPPPKSEDQVPTVALPNGNTAVLLGSCALDVAPDVGESSLGLIAGLAALGIVLVGGALLLWHQHRSGWGLVHRLRHMREQVPQRLRATMANPAFDRDDGEQVLSAVADVCRGFRAVAIGPFTPLAAGQIALRAREQVIELDDSQPWWKVHLVGQSPATAGLAPSNYLQRLAVHADDGVIAWSDVVLGEELGRGAYGAVYRAMWRGAPVAVKQLRELPEGSEEELKTFQNETRQLYRLRHPHVVQFFGAGVYVAESGQPLPFLVTELLPGGTLRALLASDLALSQPKREAIAYDVVRGMAYMHEQGVMHRDLKSDNVMMAVGPDGGRIAKVADLGTAVRFARLAQHGPPPAARLAAENAAEELKEIGRAHV